MLERPECPSSPPVEWLAWQNYGQLNPHISYPFYPWSPPKYMKPWVFWPSSATFTFPECPVPSHSHSKLSLVPTLQKFSPEPPRTPFSMVTNFPYSHPLLGDFLHLFVETEPGLSPKTQLHLKPFQGGILFFHTSSVPLVTFRTLFFHLLGEKHPIDIHAISSSWKIEIQPCFQLFCMLFILHGK